MAVNWTRENEKRRLRTQMRRLITINGKATGKWETTVGAVARAVRLTPAEVADLLRDGHLIIMAEIGDDPAAWTLEEDGE